MTGLLIGAQDEIDNKDATLPTFSPLALSEHK